MDIFNLSKIHFWKSPVKRQHKQSKIINFLRDESGPSSVEYAVMLALILAICIVALKSLGDNQVGMWGGTYDKLDAAGFITQ
jgi:pilus assembly protein Flp/PilA